MQLGRTRRLWQTKRLAWVGIFVLLLSGGARAGSMSILRFFNDGCAAIAPEIELVQICERGPRAGAPCDQMPEFGPRFSLDCCLSPEDQNCVTNNPDTFCSDPTPRRTCDNFEATGQLCVTNEGCDSSVCTSGSNILLGEPCILNFECLDPFDDPNGPPICGSAGDGTCGASTVDNSTASLGNVLLLDSDVALVAVVTGLNITPQPTNNKKDRVQPVFTFNLVDTDQLRFQDKNELCGLATQFGSLTPTPSLLEDED